MLSFFFKQKTACYIRISDWSSDVCSSDLIRVKLVHQIFNLRAMKLNAFDFCGQILAQLLIFIFLYFREVIAGAEPGKARFLNFREFLEQGSDRSEFFESAGFRSEEHTSELQSLMRISYAVFCLKKK